MEENKSLWTLGILYGITCVTSAFGLIGLVLKLLGFGVTVSLPVLLLLIGTAVPGGIIKAYLNKKLNIDV